MNRQCLTREDATRLAIHLAALPLPFTVRVSKGKVRTLSQNALLHKWYGEIAAQRGDTDAHQVKGECHHKWGLTIRLRDPQFAFVWARCKVGMDYEKRCNFLASGVMNVTSAMTTKELSEYMEPMNREYRDQGFRLTDPDMQGREDIR